MKITVLGYYGGFPDHEIGTTSYLIQTKQVNLLLDAGSATLTELEKHLDPMKLDAVILTHYHHDHTADVGVLQYYWQLNRTDEDPLPIYGHTEDPLNFGALTWTNATVGLGYSEGNNLELGELKISFLKTKHPVPTFATRIEEVTTGKVITFTADSAYFEGLQEFIKKSDLLITDTNFLTDFNGVKWHLTTKETATLFDQSESKKMLLSHLSPRLDKQQVLRETQELSKNPENIFLPEKGKCFEI